MKSLTWLTVFVVIVSYADAGNELLLAQEAGPPLNEAATSSTAADATRFVQQAESELETLAHHEERATFLNGTDETEDHQRLVVEASEIARRRRVALAKEAGRINGLSLPEDVKRKLERIKFSEILPAPAEPALSRELAEIISEIERNYTSAANCVNRAPCRTKDELYDIMEKSRDPEELLSAWKAWHAPARAIRTPYARMVEIANVGAQELGYNDLGGLWRSQYDMPPNEFLAEYERLWSQVRPLYEALHCHVRAKLHRVYGDIVPEDGLIPAHVLGNMWAQFWHGIDPLVGPGGAEGRIDLTNLLKGKNYTPLQMVQTGENFFTSLGFAKLPPTFWERSMLAQPKDRKVNCHGSTSPIDPKNGDVRMKICVRVNEEDFRTIHHELGHIYYSLSYANQPFLLQEGANPGFHEAIGDTMALSITPPYLKAIGLVEELPSEDQDLPYLFRTALDKIPQLAMAIVVDMWRWKVFSGAIPPERYNSSWWDLRRTYQGLSSPVPRTEEDFDAGMFYHVSFNVPYDRYFIAAILQFDLHRALCEAAGYKGTLPQCSIYGSHEAGERLKRALSLGASLSGPDVLESLTGRRKIDASSVVDYFAPVMAWLKEQNQGQQCGW